MSELRSKATRVRSYICPNRVDFLADLERELGEDFIPRTIQMYLSGYWREYPYDSDVADDLSQEVRLALWKRRANLPPPGVWLTRLVRKICRCKVISLYRDVKRKRKTQRTHTRDVMALETHETDPEYCVLMKYPEWLDREKLCPVISLAEFDFLAEHIAINNPLAHARSLNITLDAYRKRVERIVRKLWEEFSSENSERKGDKQ